MVRAVVAAAPVAAIIVDAIVRLLAASVVHAVVVPVMANLMFTLLMVRRVIAAVSGLRNGRHGDGRGGRQRDQASCVAEMHGY